MSASNNPFAGLVSPVDAIEVGNMSGASINTDDKGCAIQEIDIINNIVQNVFYITINPNAACGANVDSQLVFLEELAECLKPCIHIDLEGLEQALFERLLLLDVESAVIPKQSKVFKEHVVQKNVFPYLFSSMQNLQTYNVKDPIVKKVVDKMKELIFRNATTALKQPALFEGQNFTDQLLELLKHIDPQSQTFFIDVVKEFMSEDTPETKAQLEETMLPVLKALENEVKKSNLINLPIYILPAVQLFANNSYLAPILMKSCQPDNATVGRDYQNSVIGELLSLSVLPKTVTALYEFFDNPVDQSSTAMTQESIWNATKHLNNNIHKIFLALLKGGPELKNSVLTWIGKCLKSNHPRGKLWNIQGGELNVETIMCATDGFILNLGAVLLHLSQPFSTKPDDPKALKIDPTYCVVTAEESEAKSVHLDCLHTETCLLPPLEGEDGGHVVRPTADNYNFVTECFFMTHKCIDLGVRVCAEKLVRCGQEVGRAQRALADAGSAAAAAAAWRLLEPLRRRAQLLTTKFLSLQCALVEPDMLSNLHRFLATTCTWLVQVAVRDGGETMAGAAGSYAPTVAIPVELPIRTPPPITMRCLPEFLLENVIVLITLSRRGAELAAESPDAVAILSPALTLALVMMGGSRAAHNPHLRARLAECLEAMLPNGGGGGGTPERRLPALAAFCREQLFKDHPHRTHLVESLLDVFVSIEMTGQSVQFEQKFNYRRPMYLLMEFLWTIEEHRDAFTRLAREAEANMEAVHPPLFLRFVNLLMNDAIFLLDEALENMAQIRNMQTAHESGAWTSLPAQEREQNLANLSHVGTLARIDNILGQHTIKALVKMTAHAPYVFCHPTLVERIASMLNYFLLHLVGPNKKNFKVKDMKEYQFEPADTVLDICRMYVVLSDNELFCGAVCDDGRSYSPQLFSQAEDVLVRIGGGSLVGSLQEFASRVSRVAEQRARDEVILANAPDDFLDPIMSTLMLDPVTLPGSRATLDRTTIARHLLSDQSDPFNRSPLTMDQVKSNTELKERIHAWIAEQKRLSKEKENTSTE